MTQGIKATATKAEDPSSIPRTHRRETEPTPASCTLANTWHTHVHSHACAHAHTHTHKGNRNTLVPGSPSAAVN